MRPCYVLRVFTSGDAGGNPLGVIVDVTGLDDATMQEIAADLGFSETVYLDWNRGDVPHARIFTPAAEIPFAGHPLVGAGWFLTTTAPMSMNRVTCGIGEVSFAMEGDVCWVTVPPERPVREVNDAGGLLAGTGLPAPSRAWIVEMPGEYLVAEVDDPAAVADAVPDFDALADLPETYLVARRGNRVAARFFAPRFGVPEDPATGSAAVALAAVRAADGEPAGELEIHQGREIGMPSAVRLQWEPGVVRIGGTVVRDEVRVLEK